MCKTASMEMKSYLQTNHGLVVMTIKITLMVIPLTPRITPNERFENDFKQIFDSVKKIVNIPSQDYDHLDVNSMYLEEYLLHFLIENVPYIPLWTKVMTTLIHLEER